MNKPTWQPEKLSDKEKAFNEEAKKIAADYWPATGKKRQSLFFASDVLEVVDYVEHMAEKFEEPDLFKRAVVNKVAASYVFGEEGR